MIVAQPRSENQRLALLGALTQKVSACRDCHPKSGDESFELSVEYETEAIPTKSCTHLLSESYQRTQGVDSESLNSLRGFAAHLKTLNIGIEVER